MAPLGRAQPSLRRAAGGALCSAPPARLGPFGVGAIGGPLGPRPERRLRGWGCTLTPREVSKGLRLGLSILGNRTQRGAVGGRVLLLPGPSSDLEEWPVRPNSGGARGLRLRNRLEPATSLPGASCAGGPAHCPTSHRECGLVSSFMEAGVKAAFLSLGPARSHGGNGVTMASCARGGCAPSGSGRPSELSPGAKSWLHLSAPSARRQGRLPPSLGRLRAPRKGRGRAGDAHRLSRNQSPSARQGRRVLQSLRVGS